MRAFAAKPWSGQTQIIIGIDIGTTHSAVSFAYLYPGAPQALMRVSTWPGQEAHKGESKIPTLVYYNQQGEAVCFGAEAVGREALERAEEEGWQLVRHFKLHLHPEAMTIAHHSKPERLPRGTSIIKVYTDFMRYLMKNTREFFEARVVNGQKIWLEHGLNKIVIISHPNGWSLNEQAVLREAAIQANYAPRSKGVSQIRFVTEGEASVHFCLFHSNLHNELKTNDDFIVCDAGGSTVDITAYRVKSIAPLLELKETKASSCVQSGAIFVDAECRKYLDSIMASLGLDKEDQDYYVREGVEDFENSAKKAFEVVSQEYRITMPSCSLTSQKIKMRRGSVKLPGQTVQSFFNHSVMQIITSIEQQMEGLYCKHLLLVGGFGDSPYLRQVISSEFHTSGCGVTIANDSTSKAVADGSVIWCAKSSVIGRATRMAYGICIITSYDPRNPNHQGRPHFKHADGAESVDNRWSRIVDKDVVLDASKSIYSNFWWSLKQLPPILTKVINVYAWKNQDKPAGYWVLDSNGTINEGFELVCRIVANIAKPEEIAEKRVGRAGEYYHLSFNVAVQFGGTELFAHLEWKHNGETRTSPVNIIPQALKHV